jgi:hypothetical protein
LNWSGQLSDQKAYPEMIKALYRYRVHHFVPEVEIRKEQQLETKKHEIHLIEFHASISVWSSWQDNSRTFF